MTLKRPAADAIRILKPTTRQTEPNDLSRRRVVVGIQFDDAPPVRQGQFLEPLLLVQGLYLLCALVPQVHPKPVGFRLLRMHLAPVCQDLIGLGQVLRAEQPERQGSEQFDVVRVVLQRDAKLRLGVTEATLLGEADGLISRTSRLRSLPSDPGDRTQRQCKHYQAATK